MTERQESVRPRPAAGQDKRVVFVVVLALLGAWISLTLTHFHLSAGQSRPGLFRTICEITGGGCDHVLQSPWAMLPRGIPLSLAGLVYFSALALWYLIIGRPNRA
ncbi:MAG TPA: vitamin K epoxide reductase family protein, partial [Thermoanaerobaculia bacterium]